MAFYKGASEDAQRQMQLRRKRELEREELALKRRKIHETARLDAMGDKFAMRSEYVENEIKKETVGLVSLTEMKSKTAAVLKAHEARMLQGLPEQTSTSERSSAVKSKKIAKVDKTKLSFAFDDEEDGEEVTECLTSAVEPKVEDSGDGDDVTKCETETTENVSCATTISKKRFGMCPDVDTSFLPDRERQREEAVLRAQLAAEWKAEQDRIKQEEIDITFSYWDGTGHRRQVTVKKGYSIQQFIQRCLETTLRAEFPELRAATVDQLMFVKEDLILPQHYTFYDLIVKKARGKSGPLFDFSVRFDIRLANDASRETDESHAGKVCLRSWYERNKHIFPASRWEPYDPEKKWDEPYKISDRSKVR